MPKVSKLINILSYSKNTAFLSEDKFHFIAGAYLSFHFRNSQVVL